MSCLHLGQRCQNSEADLKPVSVLENRPQFCFAWPVSFWLPAGLVTAGHLQDGYFPDVFVQCFRFFVLYTVWLGIFQLLRVAFFQENQKCFLPAIHVFSSTHQICFGVILVCSVGLNTEHSAHSVLHQIWLIEGSNSVMCVYKWWWSRDLPCITQTRINSLQEVVLSPRYTILLCPLMSSCRRKGLIGFLPPERKRFLNSHSPFLNKCEHRWTLELQVCFTLPPTGASPRSHQQFGLTEF